MRLWPSCRGETTLRSSHHCNWRRLTPQIRATSLELYPSGSELETGRLFRALNILSHFRFGDLLVPTWIVPAPPAVSMGTRRTEYQKPAAVLDAIFFERR